MKRVIWGLAFLLSVNVASADVKRDIAYGEKTRNTLDLYLPDGVDNPPLVVFVHGGRWFRNDKSQIELYDRVEKLTEAGIAIASMNYTFSDEAIWPAQLEDLRSAFTFLRTHSDELGFDADRIAVWGQSSGAHLALWIGFDLARNPDTRLDAIVSWYAPSDLSRLISDRAVDEVPDRDNLDEEPTPESLLIGAPVPENADLADAASPFVFLENLSPEVPLPPTLLVHGTADFIVSPLQSERLFAAMDARQGVELVELRIVEGGGHGGDRFDAEVAPAVAFLNEAFAQAG